MVRHADTEMIVMKEEVLFTVPYGRRNGMTCGAAWGSTRVSQEAERDGGKHGQEPHCHFHGKGDVRQGKQS